MEVAECMARVNPEKPGGDSYLFSLAFPWFSLMGPLYKRKVISLPSAVPQESPEKLYRGYNLKRQTHVIPHVSPLSKTVKL